MNFIIIFEIIYMQKIIYMSKNIIQFYYIYLSLFLIIKYY